MADLGEEKYPNIHVITGALKLYLRILPVPLITFKVHPLLIDATRKYVISDIIVVVHYEYILEHKSKDLQISSIKHALLSLPRHHYDTLRYMLEHLSR